jgi:hypothetical protein
VIRPAPVSNCFVAVICNKQWEDAGDKQFEGLMVTRRLWRLEHLSFRVTMCLVAWPIVRTAIFVARSAADLAPATATTAVSVVLSPQSSEPLLLGVCVDVCADDETDNVEKGHPCSLGEELLSKSQRDGGHNPADLHDRPETSLDGCADLVECTGACNKGHGDKVNAVLNG